jgi:plasmid stabilization system protein ParE
MRHREALKSLHKSIEGHIADWNLAQADRLLYKLEDIFEKIESELE